MAYDQPTTPDDSPPAHDKRRHVAQIFERMALGGMALYAIFAPHSIAGAEIALLIAVLCALVRIALTKQTRIRRTALDVPILLFLFWTILSSCLSEEPGISLRKLQSVCVVWLFYFTQMILTRRTCAVFALLMIVSGVAGSMWSVIDLMRGRGIVIEQIAPDSPFQESRLRAGDAIWRVNSERVYSVREIDRAIIEAKLNAPIVASVISQGEHVEWPCFIVTGDIKGRASPSGLSGTQRTHRFRASGWTRHYETFCETLQILAQLALGFALAQFQRRTEARRFAGVWLLFAAFAVLALGVALTAMRTALTALVIGACVVALRATQKRARLMIAAALLLLISFGAIVVWQTRAPGALRFQDASSSLRWSVARTAIARVSLHPFFGHGMDAVKKHWTEWGFPGAEIIHTHSTPLQIAFERGLPALALWLWIIVAALLMIARAEKSVRLSNDAWRHGLLLGALGGITGFFASSFVNYNFGDAEVALVFWWLLGTVAVASRNDIQEDSAHKTSAKLLRVRANHQ